MKTQSEIRDKKTLKRAAIELGHKVEETKSSRGRACDFVIKTKSNHDIAVVEQSDGTCNLEGDWYYGTGGEAQGKKEVARLMAGYAEAIVSDNAIAQGWQITSRSETDEEISIEIEVG